MINLKFSEGGEMPTLHEVVNSLEDGAEYVVMVPDGDGIQTYACVDKHRAYKFMQALVSMGVTTLAELDGTVDD